MSRLAVYAGTFDIITIGHEWMIRQGAQLFDQLVVAIGINPDKKPVFSVEERLSMLRVITADLSNICIDSYLNQFLVHYAKGIGAQFILRGLRNPDDFEYERVMYHFNREIARDIETVFLMTPRDIGEVSSSFVKSLIGPEGWKKVVKQYVPDPIFTKLKIRFANPARG